MSSTFYVINLLFHQLAMPSTCHFITLSLCIYFLSICCFVNLAICQLAISTTCHFTSKPCHQLAFLSKYHFINFFISPTCCFVNLAFCQLAISEIYHLINFNISSSLHFINFQLCISSNYCYVNLSFY